MQHTEYHVSVCILLYLTCIFLMPGCSTGVPVSDPRTAGPLVANAEAMGEICPAGLPQWGTKRELPPAAGRGARQRRGPLKPAGFKLVAWAIHVE